MYTGSRIAIGGLLSAAVNFIVVKKIVVSLHIVSLVACSSVFPPAQLSLRHYNDLVQYIPIKFFHLRCISRAPFRL